jgi:hypothetical protein
MAKTSLYFLSGIDFVAGVLMLMFREGGRSWGDTRGLSLASYGIYCIMIAYGIALGAMRGKVPYGTFLARVFLVVFGFIFLFVVKMSTWSNRGHIEVEGNWLVYFVGILIYCFGGIFSVVMLYVNYKGGRTKQKQAAMQQLSAAEQGLDGMPASGMMDPGMMPPGSGMMPPPGMMAPGSGMMDPGMMAPMSMAPQYIYEQPGGFMPPPHPADDQQQLLHNPAFAYPVS